MAIDKQEAYSLECDGCKNGFENNSGFTIFIDEQCMLEDAYNSDWTEKDGKHYCDNCYTINDDDEIIFKTSHL